MTTMRSFLTRRRTVLVGVIAVATLAGCDSYATDPSFESNPGSAPASQLTIVNGSATSMAEVYFAPCSVSAFGNSRGTQAGFASRTFNVTPDCYDVRAVFTTREVREQRVTIPIGESRTLTLRI